MSDLDVQDAAAKADNMVNPAFLAASMIEERAPDIVEALNDMPSELAVAVLLHLPPDRAIEVLDQPGVGTRTRTRHADAAGSGRKTAGRCVGRPQRRGARKHDRLEDV